jgi:hypothetical protein
MIDLKAASSSEHYLLGRPESASKTTLWMRRAVCQAASRRRIRFVPVKAPDFN